MRKRHTLVIAAAAVVLGLGALDKAQAAIITSPNLVTTGGTSGNVFPFGFAVSSQRYQQVYAASDFVSLSEPELITKILFRPNAAVGRAFSGTLPNIQINFSTTSKAPDDLSETFADNVGSDDTVVFSGPLSLSSAFTGPANGPLDFDIAINLLTFFPYNPSAGNLLLDVRYLERGDTLTGFDALAETGDSVSRAYTTSINNVNSPTGLTDTLGLITQFQTQAQAVPEPHTLGGTVLVGVFSMLINRKAKSQKA